MIAQDTSCDGVLNQIVSVQSAINGVSKLLLEQHLESCIAERSEEERTKVVKEIMVIVDKLIK